MELTELFGQAVSLFAMAFNIASYQQTTRERAICFQLCGGLLFSVSFFLLDAIVGSLLNLIAVIRAVVFLNREKLRADHPLWLAGFTVVYLLSYWLTFSVFGKETTMRNFLVEFLPVIGMVATTVSFRFSDAKAIRRFGLISSPCWLVYNIVNFSLGAIVCETLSLGSIVIGMLRLDRGER